MSSGKNVNVVSRGRWYVYKLIDPRDNSTFYVGKGSGGRLLMHEKDADNPMKRSMKLQHIRDIWASGQGVKKLVVAEFWDEQAAYDFEVVLIKEVGFHNLTNVQMGGADAVKHRNSRMEARQYLPLQVSAEEWWRYANGYPAETKGMVMDLLVYYWNKPLGIPRNVEAMRCVCGNPSDKVWARNEPAIFEMFPEIDGVVVPLMRTSCPIVVSPQ